MRGERKAMALLQRLADAGVTPLVQPGEDGKPGFAFDARGYTEAQREQVVETVLFAIGYPGCYRTAVRIFQAEGLPPPTPPPAPAPPSPPSRPFEIDLSWMDAVPERVWSEIERLRA